MKSPHLLAIIAIVTSILAITLLLYNRRLSSTITKQDTQLLAQALTQQTTDSLINKHKQTILFQKVVITSSQEAINSLTSSVFDLKNKDQKNLQTIAYFQSRTSTSLKKVYIPYIDSTTNPFHLADSTDIAFLTSYIEDSTIRVGTRAENHEPNYSLSATIQKEGLVLNNLTIPDTLSLRFVERKPTIFRKASIEVQYFHSNPLVVSTSSNSVFYHPKKKSFFTRIILPVLAGATAGYLIAK